MPSWPPAPNRGVLRRRIGRTLVAFGLAAVTLAGTATTAADPPPSDPRGGDAVAAFDRAVLPYLTTHCVRCHGPEKQDGELRLDELPRDVGGPAAGKWLDVMERLSAGEMPPPEEPGRPAADETDAIVAWLTARIAEGEAARLAAREPVTLRRLSREEYAHTVYDLLGVHVDVADPTGLTEDDRWRGFERIGPALTLSASHVEKYFAVAEAALAEAYPDKPVEHLHARRRALDLRGGPTREMIAELEAEGRADKVRVDLWPGHELQGGRPGPGKALPAAGVYEVRVSVSGLKPPTGPAPRLAFYVEKLDRMLHEQDVVAAEDAPTVVAFRAHLPAGNHSFRVTNAVPGPSNLPRSGRSDRRPFFSVADGRIPWQMKLTDEVGVPLHPFLIVDWVEWDGPIVTDAEAARRAAYLPTEVGNLGQVRDGLARFAERAFRRPLRDGEIDRYVGLVERQIAAGAEFLAAHKAAMLAILCSKDFLYLVERAPEGTAGPGSPDAARGAASGGPRVTDFELASRLSYFLWSTMPDEELFTLARAGTLHEEAVLKGQVARMLADPRAARLAESFARQWLQLDRVGQFPPDKMLYPDYDEHLEQSLIGEATAYVAEALAADRPLAELLDSDWTMLNARLATHYGIEGVEGDGFRRVDLPGGSQRGGLLTTAAVLSLTSDGTRHRPVHRGVYVSETFLGVTPPRPPANVDPIPTSPPTEPKATLRQKLAAHTQDASCAACHRKIDPLGLAFEAFDAIGRWRTTEAVRDGVGADPPVDPAGVLPDGRAFADAGQFRRLLADDVDRFAGVFAEKLAMYALRRGMTVDDRADLAAVAAAIRADGSRTRGAVGALVLSDLFQKP